MNRTVRSLADICEERRFEEKWLLAPSLRVGHQWLDAASRAGRPALNTRVKTLRGAALEIAGPVLVAKGLSAVGDPACEILVDRIWTRRRAAAGGYLSALESSFTLTRAIARALRSLRLAGLEAGRLRPARFEVEAKGVEIRGLLEEFGAALRARRWADPADVLRIAAERLRTGDLPEGDWLVLVPSDLDPRGLDAALVAAIPPARKMPLIADDPGGLRIVSPPDGGAAGGEPGARQVAAEAPSAPAAPEPDGAPPLEVEIVRAVGEINEVRDALRRALARGVPLDAVEILHTDTPTYVALIHQTAKRFWGGEGPLADGIPVTFAEGLPAGVTRPGRALAAWLGWIAGDFPQAALVRMVRDGLIRFPGGRPGAQDAPRLAARLRRLGIGWTRDRYQPAFDAGRAALRPRADRPREPSAEDDAEEAAAIARREAQGRDLERLRGVVLGLLAASPSAGSGDAAWLDAARVFLTDFAGSANELDNLARDRMLHQVAFLRETLASTPGEGSLDPREWLSTLPGETRVGGSGPRPGCVHVDHVAHGGHTGRPHTIILGLNDARFPGSIPEDPVLLDAERRSLSGELPIAADDSHRRLEAFRALLARQRGRVTLSFPCRALEDDRELFPSPVVMESFRTLSGNAGGDHRDLSVWLARPASFAPDGPGACLDEADWWLWRQESAGPGEALREAIARRFPHLGHGLAAGAARAGALFTEYDGAVPAAGPAHDPTLPGGPVLSAHRLETLGACPLRYFFRHALGVSTPSEIVLDPETWLDQLQTGSLLHEVFYEFLGEIVGEGRTPSVERDRARVGQILDACIARYREIQPPPSISVFEREVRRLRRAARIFLASEEAAGASFRPAFLEVTVGMPGYEVGTVLDSEEPALFPLGGGRAIRVRGRVDRVDRAALDEGRSFVVWDYKTGSSKRFLDADPFLQGRIVQHVLYSNLIGARLRAAVDPEAFVAGFGYLFPSARGLGEQRTYSPEALAEGPRIVARLCEIAAAGAFLATDCAKDCSYCDYQRVCEKVDATAAAAGRKLDHADNTILAPMRELRRDG